MWSPYIKTTGELLLTAPFTEQEALGAVCAMNRNSAPRPDGFGPSFYKASWATVKVQVMTFLHAFHNGEVDLVRINRAYMVLLPKKPGLPLRMPSAQSACKIVVLKF
jgi:hypothetical protein